ncbi:uncharacterized protein LOC101471363 [Maylandia zebra]|uniref:uncharacterized protein LOC101471363 n=1 Tax=Maylandia zebra TaxID=106582 RepID=UPI00403CAE13
MDASDMTVEWSRPDLDLRLVHVWPERPELQNPSYKGRTSLFINEMKHGELSLKISRVKPSDEGKYRCFVPDLRKDSNVQLVVSAVSSPVISFAGLNKTISGVVLQCESAGWYPEPELLWLDGEGNLSAGPTETLRGPDDLYTVSSRVTVEKRHSNNITCRVQQRNTNQRRETHIHVPDDFFLVSPSGPPSRPISNPNVTVASAVSVAVVLLLIGAVFFAWKWRRGKFKKKKSEEDGAEQARKKNTINSKNSGMPVVEEQSKPLMTGREEDDDVDSREDQRHEDDRETKQDEFVLETEQIKNINSPQEKRINQSTVNDKESLITIEKETKEKQEVTGREEEDDVDNREEKNFKSERETQHDVHETEREQGRDTESPQERRINPSTVNDKESLIKMEHKTQDMTGREEKDDVNNSGKKKRQKKMVMKKTKKKLSKEVDTDSSETKTSAVTKTEPQFKMKQETHEEQSRRGRHETHNVDIREQRSKDGETQQNQPVTETVQTRDTDRPQEKRINPLTVSDKESLITVETQDMTGREEKEKETQRNDHDKKQKQEETEQRSNTDSPGTKTSAVTVNEPQFEMKQETHEEPRREKETQQEQLVEKRQMERNVDMKESETEKKRAEENSGEVNNLYSVFMAQKETQREKLEAEQQREENQKRLQPETRREKKKDEGELKIRKDNKKQYRKEEKTERKNQRTKNCLQERQEEELMEVDTQSRKPHGVCTLPVKEEKMQARKHQNSQKVKECVNKQNDQFMDVDNFPQSQYAATSQSYEPMQWTKDQQKLPVQTEPQECLKEKDEDQMEAEEYSGLQFSPFTEEHKEEPMLLGEEKSFNFSFHLSSDQEPRREKERQQEQLVEKRQMERNVDMKESDTEKKRAEENSGEVNKVNSVFMPQKETWREKLEAEQQREENQRRLQSETRREREKDEGELKIRKDNKNQPEEQRGQTESMISSVQVPLDTHLKIQGQNHKKQPEETCQQSPEQIREQPEKLRGAERKEGAQGKKLEVNEGLTSEETKRKDKEREKLQLPHEGELQAEQQVNVNEKQQLEESVSLTERGVCVEEKQEEEPMQRTCDFDQKNNQSRNRPNALKLNEVCTLPVKKQKVEEERRASKHQNFKKPKKYVKKQNCDHMNVHDAAHSQYAATSQSYEPMQWTKDQQMLPVQTEPQECLKEKDEDLQDQMEVD